MCLMYPFLARADVGATETSLAQAPKWYIDPSNDYVGSELEWSSLMRAVPKLNLSIASRVLLVTMLDHVVVFLF